MAPLIYRELYSGEESPLGGEFLQSPFWGAFKASLGWRQRRFALKGGDMLLLLRRFSAGFSLAYVPHAPDIPAGDDPAEFLARCGRELIDYLPRRCLFVRFDLPMETSPELLNRLESDRRVVKAPVDIQPPDTVVISLDPEEGDILGAMKSKTRYNVRLSAKRGVTIREGGREDLDDWYNLYAETGRRDRIALHSRAYFNNLFDLAATFGNKAPVLRLIFAEVQGETVAAIIVCRYGSGSTYMYGASSDRHRNSMPAYALQWHAMKTEKQAGSTSYDLFGIPPADDPKHPMHGLYRFKTGFGGYILRRPGCWDVPLRPRLYRLYRAAESCRNYYYKVIRKRVPG